ncbi:putative toxin-antitoxin system toxin component, PIN family [Candidatus Woesearchaeota archaeon]|nr:putative toxin-antitoxin system toxin component, PIN family [Candidatus Woesearchaeota archaeon]
MPEYTSSGKALNVVFDTNIFVSAIFWQKGNPHRLFELAIDQKIKAFTSVEILGELLRVLRRDFPGQGQEETILDYLSLILKRIKIVEAKAKLDVVKNDPDDNKILECAVACGADYIVTGDKHLLDLKEYERIKIITAATLVGIMRPS